ncbi:MAG: hypothetical protein JWO12_2203 [Frankiales bacterium]|nr:hypothetical protein [Frankiales bacterium]
MTAPRRRASALALLLAAVAATLVAGLTGVAVHANAGDLTSTALVSIDEPQAIASSTDGGVIEKLSRVRLKYISLVSTDRIAVPVATSLHLPVDRVREHLSGAALPTDLLLRLSCTGTVANKARACANALATAVVAYADQEQSRFQIPAAQRVILAKVQPAGEATRASSGPAKTLGAAVLAGGLAAALVLAVMARLRP